MQNTVITVDKLLLGAFLVAQRVQNLPAMQELQTHSFDPWVGKIPWRRASIPKEEEIPLQYSCLKNPTRGEPGGL